TLDYAENMNGASIFTVRATDTGDLSVDTTFTVTVIPVNDAPIVEQIPDIHFFLGQTAVLPLSAFVNDVDDDPQDLAWTVSGTLNLSVEIDDSTRIADISVVAVDWMGLEIVTFSVSDSSGLSDSSTVQISVGVMLGDANNDGVVDNEDVVMVSGYILNFIGMSNTQMSGANVNGDAFIDVRDIIEILEIIHNQ
ncbi:MAG: hypothetical protein B6244_14440, partial [Candidatus Cloacimonetes bacterium 4572_55]